MDKTQIINELNIIFRQVFADPAITISENMTANDIDHWNSLNHIDMITAVEKKFGIKFKLKDLTALQNQNVGGFIDMILKYINAK